MPTPIPTPTSTPTATPTPSPTSLSVQFGASTASAAETANATTAVALVVTRTGDTTAYDFWLGKLNQFNGNFVNAEMVRAFIVSSEYQGRFGP
jgi:hypothetical protein